MTSLDDFTRLLELEQRDRAGRPGRFPEPGFACTGRLHADAFGIGPWSGSARWEPGRAPSATGPARRGPAAGACAAGPWSTGSVTNPLAHAVATALAVAGCRRLEDVESVETDLYRANAIDCDDTSVVRIRTTRGLEVTCALTPVRAGPAGAGGAHRGCRTAGPPSATPRPDRDRDGRPDAGPRSPGAPTCWRTCWPTAGTGRRCWCHWPAPERSCGCSPRWPTPRSRSGSTPGPSAGRARARTGGRSSRTSRTGSSKAASTGRTFAELGAPWAHRERDRVLVRAESPESRSRATSTGGARSPPRARAPILHPVRTRAGVVLTARHPADHDWHFGVGMAIPDVNGTSFWGGGTYVHGTGYVLLDNHGEIVGEAPERAGRRFHPAARLGRTRRIGPAPRAAVGAAGPPSTSGPGVDLRVGAARRPRRHARTRPAARAALAAATAGSSGGFPACADVEVFTAMRAGRTTSTAASRRGWPGRPTSPPDPG